MPVPLKVRWTVLEGFRVLVLSLLAIHTVTLAFDVIGARYLLLLADAVFEAALVLVYGFLSAFNIYPRLLAQGFVPATVPLFTRWRITAPVIPFNSIYGIRIRTDGGIPFLMEVITKRDRIYPLSMKAAFPEEKAVALGILEWSKSNPPVRVVEGTGNIVMAWVVPPHTLEPSNEGMPGHDKAS